MNDVGAVLSDWRPTGRRKDEDREATAAQPLLMAQIAVGRDQKVEVMIGSIEQLALLSVDQPRSYAVTT